MERPNAWKDYTAEQLDELHYLCEGYKAYISDNKTERECCDAALAMAKEAGYVSLDDCIRENRALKPGDRVLLCSDGLFKTLSLQEINSIIASSQGSSAQDELLRAVLAKDKRKQDNVTLVMLYCDPV